MLEYGDDDAFSNVVATYSHNSLFPDPNGEQIKLTFGKRLDVIKLEILSNILSYPIGDEIFFSVVANKVVFMVYSKPYELRD